MFVELSAASSHRELFDVGHGIKLEARRSRQRIGEERLCTGVGVAVGQARAPRVQQLLHSSCIKASAKCQTDESITSAAYDDDDDDDADDDNADDNDDDAAADNGGGGGDDDDDDHEHMQLQG